MLPDTFSGGIGREASSLEGELWCDPKRSKRWPKLPTSGERSSGLQRRKRAELEDFRCSSQENASGNAPDSVFSSWGKKRSPDGFFPLLRIGHKSFDLRVSCSEDFNPHSWHAP
uniref:Uncharacterized protein n=1 Tax=Cucumis melo TaxID=3656 RepID=A0A9I9E2G5_CUCME